MHSQKNGVNLLVWNSEGGKQHEEEKVTYPINVDRKKDKLFEDAVLITQKSFNEALLVIFQCEVGPNAL